MTSSSPKHISLPKLSHGGVSVPACEFGDYTDFLIHSSVSGCSGYFHVFIRPGIEPWSPALQGDSSPSEPPGKSGLHARGEGERPRASSAKTRGFHTQLDDGPETP